jgi:hypothetical protein
MTLQDTGIHLQRLHCVIIQEDHNLKKADIINLIKFQNYSLNSKHLSVEQEN